MNNIRRNMLAIADEKNLQMSELLQLTKKQTTLLVTEEVERLERYTAYKQNIIDRINALDARYKEFKAQLLLEENVRCLEDVEDDRYIQLIMALNIKTKNVIKEMIDIDKKNTELGNQLLEKLGEASKHAGIAPGVTKAYQNDLFCSIFVDRHG